MRNKSYLDQLSTWGIPALYAGAAIVAGLMFPKIELRIFPDLASPMSISAAMTIYSAIASGMITLTGIVFSLTFVMVQFSATAYSPRLVFMLARDPVMSHALGVFTATFLYAIAALAGIDRNSSGKVPFFSTAVVIVLLLASVALFICLIQRIGRLQVNRILIFVGDQGRNAIKLIYSSARSAMAGSGRDELRPGPNSQTLIHRGKPRAIQSVDIEGLTRSAEASGAVIEMAVAVGDTVMELMPILHVHGAREQLPESILRRGIEMGRERTFEQDPKYAIRLLVDIAIRALSPAVNDPTTAVQALDQIGDLLLRLGQRQLEIGAFRDRAGQLRLVVPFPGWEDLLALAFDEIVAYGATSVQVMRRMNALVSDLLDTVPEKRRPPLRYWQQRLKGTIARSFPDREERNEALRCDRQGLGAPFKDDSTS